MSGVYGLSGLACCTFAILHLYPVGFTTNTAFDFWIVTIKAFILKRKIKFIEGFVTTTAVNNYECTIKAFFV
jgi:hypothetical protein